MKKISVVVLIVVLMFALQLSIHSTTPKVEYTYDSVIKEGIDYEFVLDPITEETRLNIIKDLPFGYTIYDKDDTEIIEGIRINGDTITGLKNIPVTPSEEYVISVKIVYSEGIPGLIAKISDGTVTVEELLANPLILMQLIYYVIAALSIIIGGLGVMRSKKKKIKTANDIANIIDIRTQETQEALQSKFLALIDETLLPLIENTINTNKSIVKSITLSTSKMKEAPVALLDTLKEISDVDAQEMLEVAKASVIKNLESAETKKAELTEALKSIAAVVEEKEEKGEKKSVF